MPLVAFLAVVALIPLSLWLLKRSGVGGVPASGVLKPVATLGLGTSQRVTVVELAVGVERHWLVLGVTGEQVNMLDSYAAPDSGQTPGMPAHQTAVNQLIARWRGAPSPGDHDAP